MAKKLLDQLSDALRTKHYSYRTEETYIENSIMARESEKAAMMVSIHKQLGDVRSQAGSAPFGGAARRPMPSGENLARLGNTFVMLFFLQEILQSIIQEEPP